MKLQLEYIKSESKQRGGGKEKEVESALSFQTREFVIACLKPGKLFVV